MNAKYIAAYAAVIALALAAASCASEPQYRQAQGLTWGTSYHITYRSAEPLDSAISRALQQIDATLSPFNPASCLSRINREPGGVKAHPMVAEVMLLSQQVCRSSCGAFDPTLAPLINLWGFGYEEGADEPSAEQIDSLMQLVGILDCRIEPDSTVTKKAPGTQFNFSAIAKGYGVDCVALTLAEAGCADYMVEIGGEIALRGRSPRGTGWRIQIDAPVAEGDNPIEHRPLAVIDTTDCCIATSGNYRNYRRLPDGSIASHTISAFTGRPFAGSTISATVIAPSCAMADAMATAAMAMESDGAVAMLDSLGYEALLVVADADGWQIVTTKAWKPKLEMSTSVMGK